MLQATHSGAMLWHHSCLRLKNPMRSLLLLVNRLASSCKSMGINSRIGSSSSLATHLC